MAFALGKCILSCHLAAFYVPRQAPKGALVCNMLAQMGNTLCGVCCYRGKNEGLWEHEGKNELPSGLDPGLCVSESSADQVIFELGS